MRVTAGSNARILSKFGWYSSLAGVPASCNPLLRLWKVVTKHIKEVGGIALIQTHRTPAMNTHNHSFITTLTKAESITLFYNSAKFS